MITRKKTIHRSNRAVNELIAALRGVDVSEVERVPVPCQWCSEKCYCCPKWGCNVITDSHNEACSFYEGKVTK